MPEFAAHDGTPLVYHRDGSTLRQPVVVVPGGPCRGVEYLGDLGGLASVWPLVVLHPRGTPTSGGLSQGWWRDADDVVALMDHLGLGTAHILGHSAGTRLALALAARSPERLRSLILVTPPAGWLTGTPDDGEEIAARRPEPEVAAGVSALLASAPTDEAAFQRAWSVWAPAGYARWSETEQAHARTGSTSLAASRAWFRDVPANAAQQILDARRPASLVVAGADDIMTGALPVHAYAAALGAEMVTIPACGHYPWVEQAPTFRDVVQRWLVEH